MFHQLPDKGYYIAIGGEGKMFTLRQSSYSGYDGHIRNLSHVWEEAEKKAKEITGFDLDAPEVHLNPLKSHETIDTAILRFGKHKDRLITEVAEDDIRYLVWLIESNEESLKADANYKIDRTIKLAAQLPDVIAYRKEQTRLKAEREAKWKAEREAITKSSKHIGNIDERIEFTGTVVFTKDFETEYGIGYMTKVHTDDGCEVIYWNNFGLDASEQGFTEHKIDSDKGDRITFFAAIKAHSEYQGIKQTVIKRATRGKLLEAGERNLEFINRYK